MNPDSALAKEHGPGVESHKPSFSREELDLVMADYQPDKLLALLRRDFSKELDSDAGVMEGYTLERHLQMVLGQYEKYFAGENKLPGGVSHNVMRFMLSLHDMGKPEANKNGGSQHAETLKIVVPLLKQLQFADRDQKVVRSLLKGDFLGRHIKFGYDTSQLFIEAAEESGLSFEDFFDLVSVYYRADAGSYTGDAGGVPVLDRLFIFDKKRGEMRFAPDVEERVVAYKERLIKENIEAKRKTSLIEHSKDKRTIRSFSKEKFAKERKLLAAELWAKRKEYFDTKKSHRELFEALAEQVRQKEIKAAEVARRITEIQETLRERKASRLKALFNFLEIRKLGEEFKDLEEAGREIAAAQQALRSSIQNIEQEAQDTALLDEIRTKIDSFYADQEKAWVEHQESERARDVRTVTAEHDVYLIHAIGDLRVPDTNSILRQGTTFEQKAEILALEPTLSTSTIREGDGRDNMWNRQGVILNRGRVLAASAGDAATVAGGLKQRSSGDAESNNIAESIRSSIQKRPKKGAMAYNELIVEQPEVAAFFISFDPVSGENNIMSVERVEAMASRAGVPAYGLLGGRLHEIVRVKVRINDVFDSNHGKEVERIQLGRIITPQEILTAAPIPADKKAELAESALENSAFRIASPELGQLKTRFDGRTEYLKIADIEQLRSRPRTPESYTGPTIKTEVFSGFDQNQEPTFDTVEILNGQEVQVLTTIRRPDGAEVKIIELDGALYQINRTPPFSQDAPDYRYYLSKLGGRTDTESEYIYLGTQFGGLKISEPITRENFTRVISTDVVGYAEKRLATAIAKGDTQAEKECRAGLKEFGYYLYGIGEEANQFGDTEVRDRAWQAAERLVPLTTIREVMARRLNKNEGYRITKEELG